MRGATGIKGERHGYKTISIHAPRAGSDLTTAALRGDEEAISIHAPRAGSDWTGSKHTTTKGDFNPRSPCGERRNIGRCNKVDLLFQSTLPVRGATLNRSYQVPPSLISIHAPRAGSDFFVLRQIVLGLGISIHAPRAGSDGATARGRRCGRVFQSTLPVRGATTYQALSKEYREDFNPRSPCGERPYQALSKEYREDFNPRSRAGSDRTGGGLPCSSRRFQSTLPVRGATSLHRQHYRLVQISIHAPRAGSDHRQARPASRQWIFQSTLPVRGATLPRLYGGRRDFYFNPRSPCGERPSQLSGVTSLVMISIHAPRAGSDGWSCTVDAEIYISIHAPRAGSDPIEMQ